MSVRRHLVRLAAAGTLLGGLLVASSAPAYAADDRVGVRASGSFSAGGSPGGAAIEVRKRTDGCVLLRTALGLRLDGVTAEQVRVEVNVGGRWFPVPVSGGGGELVTSRTSPANPTLCKGKSITVKYRVAFLAGSPGGRLTVAGEATTANGRLLGRAADTSRVGGAVAAPSSTPTPTPSRKPSPTPTPSAVPTETPAATTDVPTQAVLAGPTGQATADADQSSGGSMIMFFGIALVAVGAGLIALLIRNNRKDRGEKFAAAGQPAVPLPRSSGPTTYRSGGGVPGATPAPAPSTYGQQQAPARPGGLYGGAGSYPTVTPGPRSTGGVYGARPTSAPPAQAFPTSAPPAQGRPTSAPPAQGRPVSGPPAAAPGGAGGGDATTIMPRLPG
ncbi:hypothetical protein ACFY3U_03245 [Micromonospora sp. NPDC000089]|uniref:hypothetical protein n=1 Tax=unclassified Micromonospora TaxID=2617518 RepID=UPI0036C08227